MAEKQKWWEPFRVDRFEFESHKAWVIRYVTEVYGLSEKGGAIIPTAWRIPGR